MHLTNAMMQKRENAHRHSGIIALREMMVLLMIVNCDWEEADHC